MQERTGDVASIFGLSLPRGCVVFEFARLTGRNPLSCMSRSRVVGAHEPDADHLSVRQALGSPHILVGSLFRDFIPPDQSAEVVKRQGRILMSVLQTPDGRPVVRRCVLPPAVIHVAGATVDLEIEYTVLADGEGPQRIFISPKFIGPPAVVPSVEQQLLSLSSDTT